MSACTFDNIPASRLPAATGQAGPFNVGTTYYGVGRYEGHNFVILDNGDGKHSNCNLKANPKLSQFQEWSNDDLDQSRLNGVSTSCLWIGVAILAAATAVGVLGILGKLPLGPIGSPVLTAVGGTSFLVALVAMSRSHGLLCGNSREHNDLPQFD